MKINLADIRKIVNCLMDHLERTGRKEFEINEDFYWIIIPEELYAPDKDPCKFVVGQLTEDWERLREIRDKQSPPIGYALVWLSAILRRIGEKAIY